MEKTLGLFLIIGGFVFVVALIAEYLKNQVGISWGAAIIKAIVYTLILLGIGLFAVMSFRAILNVLAQTK